MSKVRNKEYLSSFSLWGESLSLLKKVFVPALKLSTISLFLPLVVFSFLFSYLSAQVGSSLDSISGSGVITDLNF